MVEVSARGASRRERVHSEHVVVGDGHIACQVAVVLLGLEGLEG